MLEKHNVADILPLNDVQKGLLFHYLNSPDTTYYFEQVSLVVEGCLLTDCLIQAYQQMADQHEALRTIFRWEGLSQPVQIVLKKHVVDIQFYDIAHLKEEAIIRHINQFKKEDLRKGFDWEKVPFRIQVLSLNPNQHLLLLSYHHLLFDGWSLGIVISELVGRYSALTMGERFVERTIPSQKHYRHFIEQQNKDQHPSFWKKHLQGLQPKFLRSASTEIGRMPKANFTRSLHFSKQQLDDYIKTHQISLSSFFYGVWGIVLHRYLNSEQVSMGIVVANRMHQLAGVGHMIGMFAQTLPLRIAIDPQQRIADYLKTLRVLQDEWGQYGDSSLLEVMEAI
ncbi:MAG: condensation domain-containing protein, partial [Bacteroidota bacterium]